MENNLFKRSLIRKGILGGCFAVLTAGALIGISVANAYIKPYEGFITAALCSVDSGGATNSLGDKLAVQIEQEGAVLAKNDDNVLPLSKQNKRVNVFGHAVVDWLISNSGSGSAGPGSAQKSIGLLDALDNYGVEYNTDIIDYYKSWCAPRSLPFSISCGYDSLYRLADPSLANDSKYKEIYDSAVGETDTAIVVIQRVAGEHIDPPHEQINNYKTSYAKADYANKGYLELTLEEEELLTAVGQDYENVVVIINSSNVIQCDFMRDIDGLDSCLIVGPTGTVGAKAIPQLLYGDINPSGRTADTWPMNHRYNPAYFTSGYWPTGKGPYYTGNPSGSNLASQNTQANTGINNLNFADYLEGIYVGYKWYETADAEGFWDQDPYNGYENVVAYPFGHGLSYTTFDWEVLSSTPAKNSQIGGNEDITVQVKVTNTGDRAGRDVVEAYLTAPYYNGEIEKASVRLVGFQKTKNLVPGDSQIVDITLHTRDFLSFDSYDDNNNGHTGWELDKGEYEVKFMQSAHVMKDENDSIKFKVANTIDVDEDTTTGEPSKPLFSGDDAVDGISCDGKSIDEPIEYITRADFAPLLTELKPNRPYNEGLNTSLNKAGAKAPNAYSREEADAWDNATGVDAFGHDIPTDTPTFGEDHGLKVLDDKEQLTDLGIDLAKDYNDDQWEEVLDQVSWSESSAIVRNSSSYNRPGIKSVGLRNGSNNDYKDVEGASQVGVDLDNKTKRLTAYPTPTVQAQCWNYDMSYLFGLSEAKDMIIGGADALYGPASNIHRTPYGGRNSEYHSEDGFLAGIALSGVTKGLADGGKSGFIKHFAVNDTEYHRVGLYTWLTEQALREVYLRPFEEAVKRGEANAVMTSFNRVGAQWTGGSEALIQGVLRNEWGFKGMIITDMIESSNLMDINEHFRAGCNYVLGGSGWNTGIGGEPSQSSASPRLQHRMRENAKQVIYAHIRCLYNNYLYNNGEGNTQIVASSSKSPWVWWKPALAGVETIVVVACIYGFVAALLPTNPEFRAELKVRLSGKKED